MMNRYISFFLFSFAALFPLVSIGQLSDKEKLTEALYLVDEKQYESARPLLLELIEKDKENANINYHLGLTYLNSYKEEEKKKALPYLELASKKISANYSAYSPKEKKAPVLAWFHLGEAQHSDYQFMEAIESFTKFKTYINEKHILWNAVDQKIRMANYAALAVQNPVNVTATNLGDLLNGIYPDFSPVIRIDESAIYFTSRRLREDSSNQYLYDPLDGMLYEDIYVSFNKNGEWGEAYPLNINTEGHEAAINLSIDGRTLYVYRDINGNGELYESFLEDDSAGFETWSIPEKLGSDINTKAYETHVTVTPDQKTLYFISDREGGLGGKDIYYCKRLPTGDWSLARNAGPILNRKFDEDGVFMHPDGQTLYFSSNGHKSMGGYDINFSTLTDSGWTTPENLGYPVNSVDDDVFFVTTPDGKRAYFSSFKEKGQGEKDIYMLELLDAEETALTLYRGEFTFVDRLTPPSGAQVTIIDNETGELGVYNPRERDGQFSAILTPNRSYHFIYEADAYESYEEDIYVPASNSYSEIYKDIKLKPVRVGKGMDKITPAPIAFADIKGGISKIGKPLKKIEIQLLDAEENLIQKTNSDSLGDFQFAKLDPSETHLIRVISEDGNPLQNYDVSVTNDQGEVLDFEELNDTTYIFTPSLSPFEFYGITAKEIAGSIKKAGMPVEGLKVRLENQGTNVIQQEETDQLGNFNFEKLSLDETYRIVFEGDFPDDPEILITNEMGQKLAFRQVDEGVFEYVPVTIDDEEGVDMAGVVKKNGVPLSGLNVRLENSEKAMLQQQTTDSGGEFDFKKLNLDETYRIVFEGDFPEEGEIVLLNEFGQELNFVKVAEGIYEYVPEGVPVPTATLNDIAGSVKSSNGPVTDLKVLLYNKDKDLLNTAKTDNVGKFNFMKLNLAQRYTIEYEGDYPEDISLEVKNDANEPLLFRKIEEGIYLYDPTFVRLEASNSNIIKKEITENVDEFNYAKLDLDQEYRIIYEGEFPDDELIEITNEDGEKMIFKKVKDGEYVYTPKLDSYLLTDGNGKAVSNKYIRLEEANRSLIDRLKTNNVGVFNYKKLPIDKEFWIVLEDFTLSTDQLVITNDLQQELIFIQQNESEYRYIPQNQFGIASHTVGVEGKPDFKDTYPRPIELKNVIAYFQKYFIYNAKDIDQSNKEFETFINDIVEMVKIRGFADIVITSSASKVPTKTWKTNAILTKKRANDTKALLEKKFKENGIKESQYNFIDINTLITGPEYKGDFLENKSTYEKYQYVRIFVK